MFVQLVRSLSPFYRVVVAANPDGAFARRIRPAEADFFGVELGCRFPVKPVSQILKILRNCRIDILHSQGARADFFCRLAGRIAGTPNILCTVAMPVEGFNVAPLKKKAYRLAEKLTERYVKRFIVVSDALRKLLVEKRSIDERRVVRIYNGVELERYAPGHSRFDTGQLLPVPAGEILIGCFGRLVWQKGIEYLIRSVPAVTSKFENTRFVIVGDGPERSYLEKIASEINVSKRVVFTGFVDNLLPWLSRVDIVAIPSLQEGFPMITLEAMAMGKPIVATQIDGIAEQLQHRRTALLVPPRSPAALSEAMAALIQNKTLAGELGRKARRSAEEHFSLATTVNATKQLYDSLLRPVPVCQA